MAGRGPQPKDPNKRARTNQDPVQLRVIHAEPTKQPVLPDVQIESDGELVDFVWPAQTREWWVMWAGSPLSASFTATDWSELRDTALIHARHWKGDKQAASELRLRVAKFGATPEDRARLRIQFAQADEADAKPEKRASSRDRAKGVRAVGE